MRTCHWMSHWTPHPAMTLDTRRSQSTVRLSASVSTGARVASKGRSLVRTLTRALLRDRLARRLDGDDFDIEEERLPGKRMVEIQHDGGVLHCLDGHGTRLTVLAAGEEARSDHVGSLRERVLGHLRLGLG